MAAVGTPFHLEQNKKLKLKNADVREDQKPDTFFGGWGELNETQQNKVELSNKVGVSLDSYYMYNVHVWMPNLLTFYQKYNAVKYNYKVCNW